MTDNSIALEAMVAAIEFENERLRRELALPKAAPRVLSVDGPFMLPTLEQVGRLVDICLGKFPHLRPSDIDDELFTKMVRAALCFIGALPRMKKAVDKNRDCLSWLRACNDYLNVNSPASSGVRGSSLYIAALVSNDVYVSSPSIWPTCDIGLVAVGIGDRNSYKATNQWLRVLQDGRFDHPRLIVERPRPLHEDRPAQADQI